MDLQNIRTFLQVASFENFTKAAEELNYAQSTVTIQIQQLEKELGFPLFERIGRRNYLTAAGVDFLSQANEILRILQSASAKEADNKNITGKLRIGVLQSLMFCVIAKLVPEIRTAFPNVEINIHVGPAVELFAMLKQNQLDILYVSSALINDPALNVCYRHIEEISFIACSNHPLADKKKIPLKEVLVYPFISTEPTGYCYRKLHELATSHNISLRHPIMINDIAAIRLFLTYENSLAFMATCAIQDEIDNGELVRLNIESDSIYYYSQIVYHKNKWLSPYMQFFINLIRKYRPEC